MTVVRNEAYTRASLGVRERHNERKNETYYNSDIVPERAGLNVHFKQFDGTYAQAFDALLSAGVISTRGQKPDAKIVDEMVFDVNTNFFEERGGYEYAIKFYEEAYRCAIEEAGGEQYVLSAVLHADERNKAESEQLGHDVFHYHLHVVYVPVVPKEIRWTKRCKDPALVGTVKETITQVSHSKKWPRVATAKGFVNSYSLLQDRFFEHMKAAGFDGFERGERSSTAEHLEVLDYKIQQDTKRLDALSTQVEKKTERIEKLDAKIATRTKAAATISEVDAMGKPALLGGFTVTTDELEKLKVLAKKSVSADKKIAEARKKQKAAETQLATAERDRDIWKNRYNSLMAMVKDFLPAIRNFPQKLRAFIDAHWQERRENQQKKTHGREESR